MNKESSGFRKGSVVSVVCGCGVVAALVMMGMLYPLSGSVVREAHAARSAVVHERHELMEEMEELVAKLAVMANGDNEYNADVARHIGNQIGGRLSRAQALFATKSVSQNSLAKKEIWENKPAFDKLLNNALLASRDIANLEKKDDLLVLVNEMDNQCSRCHGSYRD